MPRLRALVAAALTLGAVVLPRAEAAPEWVLSGSRTAYVDVTLDTSVALTEPPTVTTRGRFAGVYVEQLSFRAPPQPGRQRAQGGWVAVRGLASDPARLDPMRIGGMGDFQPGVVRVYLIADGPTSVHLPHSGAPELRSLRPTRPAHASARVTPLAERDGVWSAALPMRLPLRNVALAAVQVTGERSVLADATVCVRSPRAACPEPFLPPLGGTATGNALVGPLDPERRWESSTASDFGDAVAYAAVDPAEPLSRAVLASFTLTLA